MILWLVVGFVLGFMVGWAALSVRGWYRLGEWIRSPAGRRFLYQQYGDMGRTEGGGDNPLQN